MGFQYHFGGEKNEQVFNNERANKWSDATVPLSGTTIYLSGASPQRALLSNYGKLYIITLKQASHMVATTSPTLNSTTAYHYCPAEMPTFHIPVSGSSEYVSIAANSGSTVEAWLSIAERTEG